MDTSSNSPLEFPLFKGAGCVFHSSSHILAGYQKTTSIPILSGIGGKREEGETPTQTALRETLEELFGIRYITPHLLTSLELLFTPHKIIQNRNYFLLTYSFEDLERILYFLESYRLQSPLFDTFPRTITELLLNRKVIETSEITHLAILPLVNHPLQSPYISPAFLKDMKLILGGADAAHSQEEDRQNEDS